jgi:formylglycine-generating enzyme required for sulfatase activity
MVKLGDSPELIKNAVQEIWRVEEAYIPDDLADAINTLMGIKKGPPPVPPVITPPTPKRLTSLDLMPKPFVWIPIPAGKVTLVEEYDDESYFGKKGESETFDVPEFSIAKYPVTNAQFAEFMKAGGYDNSNWWTDSGWKTRQKEKWKEPRYWKDSVFATQNANKADHPVVGVSWYEAVAFCLWLSEAAGENITLPTEQQWQRAAQGDDGRAYPWGKEWDGKRCNNSVGSNSSSDTTPVTQYEGKDKGDSPYDVTDLSGNVWEWCLTVYSSGEMGLDGTDNRVLRGGSWVVDNTDYLRAGYRNRYHPSYRYYIIGFRVATS